MDGPDLGRMVGAGWRLIDVGNPKGALAQFQQALGIDPKHVPALIGAAQAQLNLGDLVQGQALVTALLAEAPNNAAAHRLQAEIHRRGGHWVKAAASAREAIALDPDEPFGYHILALTYSGANDYTSALKICAQGLARAPACAFLMAQTANNQLVLKGGKTAEPMAREALRLDPDSNYVLKSAARVALARNQLSTARDLLTTVLRRNANDEEAVTLYLLTDPARHGFLRGRLVFNNWRKEHGAWGELANVGLWTVGIVVVVGLALVTHIAGLAIGLGLRFFLKSQYDAHRREVKAHFAQASLASGF